MRALPCMEIVDPTIEEYSEKREERVRSGCDDGVELEKRVKVEYCWIGQCRGDRVQRHGLCGLRRGF